jgi:hypothetical protein
MKSATLAGGAFATVLVLLVLAANHRAVERNVDTRAASTATSPSPASTEEGNHGFIYGRVTRDNGTAYEGRLRFGGDQEAFWGDYFNGFKAKNQWATHAPLERLTEKRRAIRIFGFEISLGKPQLDLGRPLMARFGDIARVEARGRDLRVTLKSGTVFLLDRFAADDFADGLRVWDARRGVVDLDEWRIRSIELLPTARLETAPDRLHGTVRTGHGDFTGFIQWNRQEGVGTDELVGHAADAELRLRFNTIRSITRQSAESSRVTLRDGREIVLSGTRELGHGHRGIYVDDRRYGRVLVSWDAFEGIEFSAGGSGPAYDDFPPGRPLTGNVITRAGRRLTGRLVYDLDESETTETLDAPCNGVDYTIPFGLIASIALVGLEDLGVQRARVTLHHGEELPLERTGDLGEGNAGILIWGDGGERPEYVQWTDVAQVDLDRPPVMYPPLARH